ncbi:DUF748 domain-containing protein, partial [Candidatus Dependentiae bacterium]|nr:DUF748 domain-containing protein [Candidatus Dependentiae bacterium]
MSSVILLKKILLISILIIVSSIDNVPYVSKIIPYYLKTQFKEYNKKIKIADIDFSVTNGEIKISDLKILNSSAKPEIEIKSIRINLGLWNILKNNTIDVTFLKIDGMKLKLNISQGKTNLDYLGSSDQNGKKITTQSDRPVDSFDDFNKKYSFKNIEVTNSEIELVYDSDKLTLKNTTIKINEFTNLTKRINILFDSKISRGKINGFIGLNIENENIDFNISMENLDFTLLKNTIKSFTGADLYGLNNSGFIKGSIYRKFSEFNFLCKLNCKNGTFDYKNQTIGFRNLIVDISEYNSVKKKITVENFEANHLYFKTDFKVNYESLSDTSDYIKEKSDTFSYSDEHYAPDSIDSSYIYNTIIKNLSFQNSNLVFKIGLKTDTLSISFDSVFLKTENLVYDKNNFYTDIDIKSLINGSGSLEANLIYRNKLNFSTKFNAKNLSLPNFNPYFKDYTGYRFNLGKIDINNSTEINDSEIISTNTLLIYNPEIKKINDIFDIPLEFALKKLKDKNGVVKLEIPVKGKLDDMEFSYSKAVWKIIGKTVLSPLSFLMKPFDSKNENYFLVQFDYNSAALNENAKNTLNSVAEKIISDKKKKYKIELKFIT